MNQIHEFKARLLSKLSESWHLFHQNIPICYITDKMDAMCDLFDVIDHNRTVTEILDQFRDDWDEESKNFPLELDFQNKTLRIEQLLQLWADYHTLEARLE